MIEIAKCYHENRLFEKGAACPDCKHVEDVNVDCDQNCNALLEPRTIIDVLAALEHWRRHSWCFGCSHGG